MDHATHESKYVNNLIEPKKQHEDDFGYIISVKKLYKINIWVYKPRGEVKVELFKREMILIKIEKMLEYWFGKCTNRTLCSN